MHTTVPHPQVCFGNNCAVSPLLNGFCCYSIELLMSPGLQTSLAFECRYPVLSEVNFSEWRANIYLSSDGCLPGSRGTVYSLANAGLKLHRSGAELSSVKCCTQCLGPPELLWFYTQFGTGSRLSPSPALPSPPLLH